MTERIEKLIEEMSLEEKARQLTQVNAKIVYTATTAAITGTGEAMGLSEEDKAGIGSVLNFSGADEEKAVQDDHLSKDPHKIPLIFMQDVIHGCHTIFPVPLALGCSFDEALAEECAEMSAVESRLNGVQLTFSPMVDLVRDAPPPRFIVFFRGFSRVKRRRKRFAAF